MPNSNGLRQIGRIALLVVMFACVSACGHTLAGGGLGGPTVTRVDSSELPGPEGQMGNQQVYVHRLGPFDKLVVDVLAIEQLSNRKFTVDGSGNITVPVAGVVHVAGLTLAQATDQLTRQLAQNYVRNPMVAVNLEESTNSYVTVDGEVKESGNYPIVDGMTLMRAVAQARGASDLARLKEVVIHRTVNGRPMIALYDLAAIRAGAYSDPVLYPHDIVVVGDSPGRRMLLQLTQIAPLFLSPLITFLQYN